MSVIKFFELFPDERACLRYVFETRWGDHSPCPECGKSGRWHYYKGTKKYRHICRAQISVSRNTFFYRTNLSLMCYFYAGLLLCNSSIGVRTGFIRRHMGLGSKSAYRLLGKLRLQMAALARPRMIGGPGSIVYVDEVLIRYVISSHFDPKPASIIVMGFACEGSVVTGIIPDRRAETVVGCVEKFVAPGSTIISDCHASYKGLTKRGWDHRFVNHARSFYDEKGNTTNPIEAYWSVLKRSLRGHRMIEDSKAWLYLAESEFRYNHRMSPTSVFDNFISAFPDVSVAHLPRLKSYFDWRQSPNVQIE